MAYLTAAWSLVASYWPALVAIALPFVVAWLARCTWSSSAKAWALFALALAVGVVGAFATFGVPPPTQVAAFALAVYGGAQGTYLVARRFKLTSGWLDKLLAIGSPPRLE